MVENFLRGPMESPLSPPYNEGDGITMGAEVGAKLENMDEAWWNTSVEIPGESWEDGSQVARIASGRILPGAIIVNDAGNRFANEAAPYNELGKSFHEYDETSRTYKNIPAYQIMDHDFRQSYAVGGTVLPEDDLPSWITKADTLEELADILGIDADGLQTTVERFNSHASDGEDPDFHKGESQYDRHMGDPDAEHPNLAPVDEPPYYAFEIHVGAMGTKGGLSTTTEAEVLNHDDDPISGLYASSNSTAHLMGTGYAGSGATIGPNITYGFIAGENAADRAERRENVDASI
jgi:succinate dehydrogenase/fumarate reductase flavoprotein subunit